MDELIWPNMLRVMRQTALISLYRPTCAWCCCSVFWGFSILKLVTSLFKLPFRKSKLNSTFKWSTAVKIWFDNLVYLWTPHVTVSCRCETGVVLKNQKGWILLTFSCPTTILKTQLSGVGWWSCTVTLCLIFVKGRLWCTQREREKKNSTTGSLLESDIEENKDLKHLLKIPWTKRAIFTVRRETLTNTGNRNGSSHSLHIAVATH